MADKSDLEKEVYSIQIHLYNCRKVVKCHKTMQNCYRNMQIKYSAFVQKLKETKHCYVGSLVPAHLTQTFPFLIASSSFIICFFLLPSLIPFPAPPSYPLNSTPDKGKKWTYLLSRYYSQN